MPAVMSSRAGPPATRDAAPSASASAWTRLLDWQRDGARLAFVYSRSLGGLMQTGHGRLSQLGEPALTIETAGSRLLILLAGASYEAGPQLFFTPNLLERYQVDGVAVRLANHDWLFLSAEAMPAQAALPA